MLAQAAQTVHASTAAAQAGGCDCALSVYASRETPAVLQQTLASAVGSIGARHGVLDLIVNGNRELAQRIAEHVLQAPRTAPGAARPPQGSRKVAAPDVRDSTTTAAPLRLRVWDLRLGDKAAAWNQYVHAIAPAAEAYVFIDGYVRLDVLAVGRLLDALRAAPGALAATGVPRVGRSALRLASAMRRDGGIHGNLFALKSAALAQLRHLGFRLPLGIYRTDPTLGAALSFGLDQFPREWRPHDRIVLEPGAGWDLSTLSWWRPADWRSQFRRLQRQAQGTLENAAVRQHFAVLQRPFGSLPGTAAELVQGWLESSPADAQRVLRKSLLARRALARLRERRDWSLAAVPPALLVDRAFHNALPATAH